MSVLVRLVGITALLGQASQGRGGLVGHEHSHASNRERGVDLEAGEHPLSHVGGGRQGEVLGDDVARCSRGGAGEAVSSRWLCIQVMVASMASSHSPELAVRRDVTSSRKTQALRSLRELKW